jgi:hypothetical protein
MARDENPVGFANRSCHAAKLKRKAALVKTGTEFESFSKQDKDVSTADIAISQIIPK